MFFQCSAVQQNPKKNEIRGVWLGFGSFASPVVRQEEAQSWLRSWLCEKLKCSVNQAL